MKISRQYPLNALKVFEAAARHLSFTRAGEELGMTQTAVSYQIKLLEDNIGEPLFLRRPRQILLTEAGEQLAPKVAEAFAMLKGEAPAGPCASSRPRQRASATTTPRRTSRPSPSASSSRVRPSSARSSRRSRLPSARRRIATTPAPDRD